MKTLIILLFPVLMFAQKVDVYDINGNLLTPLPIEKKSIPDKLNHYPDGKYKLKELLPYKSNGKYLFKECWYIKETQITKEIV